MNVTIYHNPACTTSRNVLQYLRDRGVQLTVVEYLKTPPDRATLKTLLKRMNMKPADLVRRKGDVYAASGLDDPAVSDERILDAMLAHPVLIERPIVATQDGAALCRPWEKVKTLVPT
jgi:arsenate reductase